MDRKPRDVELCHWYVVIRRQCIIAYIIRISYLKTYCFRLTDENHQKMILDLITKGTVDTILHKFENSQS